MTYRDHLLRLGEDSILEFKPVMFERGRVARHRRPNLADDIAAFAKGRGGTMLLGMEDASRLLALLSGHDQGR